MSRTNVMVYPVNEELRAYIEYAEMNKNITIQDFCVPEEWYICGKKMSLNNGKEIELNNINDCLIRNTSDVIIIFNNGNEFDFELFVEPYLERIVQCKKKLYFVKKLENKEKDILEKYKINYELFSSDESLTNDSNRDMRLLKISTPIIFVLGMFENTDKLSTLFYIHNYLKQKKYEVKTVLTRDNILDFEDCYSFPEEMFDKKYSDTQKIIFFNNYIRRIEVNEKPDVIVIGIPGEMMPLNEIHNGHFGIMPFLIGNAVRCDYAILNIYSNFSSKEFAQQLAVECKNRFLIEINSVVISKMVLDITSLSMDKLKVYHFSNQGIELDDSIFYDWENNEGESLGENILNVLLSYGNYSKI